MSLYATTYCDHKQGEPSPDPAEPCQPDDKPFATDRDVRWVLISSAAVVVKPLLIDGEVDTVRIYWFWEGQ